MLLPPESSLPSLLCSLRLTSWDSFTRVPLLTTPDSPIGGPRSGHRQTVVPKAASLDRIGTCHRSIGGTGDGGAGSGKQGGWERGQGALPAFPVRQGSSPQPLQPLTPPWCAQGDNSGWRETGHILCFRYWPWIVKIYTLEIISKSPDSY